MELIWTSSGPFRRVFYASEADLGSAILQVQRYLFGPGRIYLYIKRKIGVKGSYRNIPDGYLLDLTGRRPRLYAVKNEIAAHDQLQHIAVQILQFSLSFTSEPRTVRAVLFDAIQATADIRTQCEQYASTHGYRNLDHMLDWLVFEVDQPFAALVVIDEIPQNLERALVRRFQFGVEVLELARYENASGERFYRFEPFLADVIPIQTLPHVEDIPTSLPTAGTSTEDFDTIVIPARDNDYQQAFLGEDHRYEARVHGSMRPQIKYIATFRVAPIAAITHFAPVGAIEPRGDAGKFVINLAESAREIGPIPLVRSGRITVPQNLWYANHERLLSAINMDDIW